MLADAFYWDPSRIFVTIPGIDWPVAWYGVLFALGFILSYFILARMLRKELQLAGSSVERSNELSYFLVDRLCWFIVAGTLISARLGHVFFYGWDYYRHHLSDIPKVWEGGLASHGSVIGIVLAALLFVCLYGRRALPNMTLVNMLDLLAAPVALTGFLIRMGNFINQEIVGTPTSLPWAVFFAHPADGVEAVPRHPVQLYEGIFYLALFFVFRWMWMQGWHRARPGVIMGTYFVTVFSWRFLMEFFKAQQGGIFEASGLQTGQVLSIPLIMVGLWFVLRRTTCSKSSRSVNS